MGTHPLSKSDRIWLRLNAALTVAVAASVLAGYVLHAPGLVDWVGGQAPMVANAGIAALLMSAGFLALAAGWRRILGAFAAILLLFVLVNLVQYFGRHSMGFHQVVSKLPWPGLWSRTGAMAPQSCAGYGLVGFVQLLIAWDRARRGVVAALAGVIGGMVLFSALQLLTWLIADHGQGLFENMAPQTAVCLFLGALSMLKVENAPADGSLPVMTAALGTVVSIVVISIQSRQDLQKADAFVAHSYQVQAEVSRFVEQIARGESACRAFALTGMDSFLKRVPEHEQEAGQAVGRLETLVADNPAQRGRIGALRRLADEKAAQNQRLLEIRRTRGGAAASAYLAALTSASGQPTSALVNTADAVDAEEARLLQERLRQQEASQHSTATVQTAGAILALLLLTWALRATRRAAAERHAADEQFRSAFEDAGVGMALVSTGGAWLRANHSISEILGYSEAELSRLTFQQITHPDDLAADLEHVGRLLSGLMRRYQMEKRYIRKDGQVVWAILTVSVVRDQAGGPRHFISQIEDITKRKLLEEELRGARDEAVRLAEAKADFLANMSHEIRTPMNGVLGISQLLAEAPLAENYHTMAMIMHASGESLLRVINDVLDFSKLEAGAFAIRERWFDLPAVVETSVSLFRHQAEQKKLSLELEAAEKPSGSFFGDSGRIGQILNNLLGNAVKFTDRGRIVVRTGFSEVTGDSARLRVEVQDSGIGIPDEAQAALFRRFAQARHPAAEHPAGTGLGLAISERLVALMQGRIGLSSTPGAGSTFWFEIPLRHRAATAESKTETAVAAPGDSLPLRVLLVEDNEVNQFVATKMLENLGQSVEAVTDGQQALGRLASSSYDIVLMDCHMPVMDGYEATRHIRSGRFNGIDRKIRIVGLTANAFPEDRAKCLAAGMDAFLAKPLRKEELVAALCVPRDGAPV